MDLVLNNDDLLTEIFHNLPVRSLIRFKSVCKNWNSLISDNRFCHQYTLRRPKLQQPLILQIDRTLELFYFNPTVDGEKKLRPYSLTDPGLGILHACNGLLLLECKCCELSNYTFYDPRHQKKSFYVYNPATKRSRKIRLTKNYDYPYVAQINLAFDPSVSPYYKVVCLRSSDGDSDEDSYTFQVEVYDSESHTWKLKVERWDYHRMSYGVYWNNGIYWSTNGDYCNFDIAKNEMKLFRYPHNRFVEGVIFAVHEHQELNGHLYHYELVEAEDTESVVLWEFGENDDGSWWRLKYNHPLTLSVGNDFTSAVKLVGSDADGTCSLVTYRRGKIRVYNFVDKSYEDLVDVTSQPFYRPGVDITGFQFGETLALV